MPDELLRLTQRMEFPRIERSEPIKCPACGAMVDPYATDANHQTTDVTALGATREVFAVTLCRAG